MRSYHTTINQAMRFILLAFILILNFPALAQQQQTVYCETGRFGGWPANHGIWSWGNEILVGFSAAWWEQRDVDRHQMNAQKGEEPRLARSLDGGRTWRIETPRGNMTPEFGGAAYRGLTEPMDFTRPGFVLSVRFANNHVGPSHLWFSYDKGQSWRGGFVFPDLGLPGIAARTDYVVLGPREALVFLTAAKASKREGRPFCARTKDGGMTWQVESMIGPEPPGFSIMPSSPRLSDREWLTAVRVTKEPENWIEQYRSTDGAATWKSEGRIADTGAHSGNAPHLIRLRDGRLCLTYGYRSAPYGIHAKISSDNGRTWGPVIRLRDDAAAWDIGYPRSAQRSDGKVVTVYYYNDGPHSERFIAATVWDPGKR